MASRRPRKATDNGGAKGSSGSLFRCLSQKTIDLLIELQLEQMFLLPLQEQQQATKGCHNSSEAMGAEGEVQRSDTNTRYRRHYVSRDRKSPVGENSHFLVAGVLQRRQRRSVNIPTYIISIMSTHIVLKDFAAHSVFIFIKQCRLQEEEVTLS